MRFGQLPTTQSAQATKEFYKYVRDEYTAKAWHNMYTPWFDEKEIEQLSKCYDFKGIEEEWKKESNGDPLRQILMNSI